MNIIHHKEHADHAEECHNGILHEDFKVWHDGHPYLKELRLIQSALVPNSNIQVTLKVSKLKVWHTCFLFGYLSR